MITLLLVFGLMAVIAGLFCCFQKKNRVWLKHGMHSRCVHFEINKHRYYLEEVRFKDYREAYGAYEKTITAVFRHGQMVNTKYDLYDWTVTYIQFNDITIGIQLCRPIQTLQLVQSEEPITIQAMEMDNPFLQGSNIL